MPREIHYPGAQKWRVVDAVRMLSSMHQRPVCSSDLRTRFRDYPDEHPLLLQALGQVLQKAARPCPRPAIFPIGVIGKYSYYAPTGDPIWHERLEVHRLKLAAEKEIRENLPHALSFLLSSELQPLAANSLSGFVEQWTPVALRPDLSAWSRLEELTRILERAQTGRSAQFQWVLPEDLLDRRAAEDLLRYEYQLRADAEHDLSLYRHMAELSRLSAHTPFGTSGRYFSRRQIQWYVESKWSWDPLAREYARGVLLALRYGTGGLLCPSPVRP